MPAKTVRVLCDHLKIGMYVSDLDRPWLETPFLMQGFQVQSVEDLAALQKYCHYVHVDAAQSRSDVQAHLKTLQKRSVSRPISEELKGRKLTTYSEETSVQEEYPRALQAFTDLEGVLQDLVFGGDKLASLDIGKIRQAVSPLVNSITRNPDACIWLARIKSGDEYNFRHALGCAIWCVALGRQLGLPKADLNLLALGGVLFDIGKTLLPKDILTRKDRLSEEELEEIRTHPAIGLQAIKEKSDINDLVCMMIIHHHERFDGTGYPDRLAGSDIPLFARIAAIADCYDAITNYRYYAKAISSAEAIKKLYEWKDIDFQGELIEEFIQAIGIYPSGTLVELSTGEVGVVVAVTRARRLRPKIILLLDREKAPVANTEFIDLCSVFENEHGEPLNITRSLESDAYGINLTALKF